MDAPENLQKYVISPHSSIHAHVRRVRIRFCILQGFAFSANTRAREYVFEVQPCESYICWINHFGASFNANTRTWEDGARRGTP